jgi:hypothetical protein
MYIAATTRAQKNSRIAPPYYGVVSHHEVAKLSLKQQAMITTADDKQ